MTPSADPPHVVFDCNVLIQAMANRFGPAGQSLNLLERNLIRVFVSRVVLRELRLVLQYPDVRRKLPGLTDEHIEGFIGRFVFKGSLVRDVPHVFDYPRAVQDEPYIDLASVASADFLVLRDKDLLSLATDHSLEAKQFRQKFPSLKVLKPAEFLKYFEQPEIAPLS